MFFFYQVQENNQKKTVLKSTVSIEDPRHQLKICARNLSLPEPIYRILPATAKTSTVMGIYAHVKVHYTLIIYNINLCVYEFIYIYIKDILYIIFCFTY